MKKQSALLLTVTGAVVVGLCIVILVLGVLESRNYQHVEWQLLPLTLLGLGTIGGMAVLVVGIKQMRAKK